jgi:RNA polymerase sigma-54 factor
VDAGIYTEFTEFTVFRQPGAYQGQGVSDCPWARARPLRVRHLSPYTALVADLRRDGAGLTDAECRHVHAYLTRAKLFVSNLTQRNRMLHHITAAIVAAQREFLIDGVRYLKPLSRADVARQIGVNESTVSRATASKHVMLPSGEVAPCTHFFTSSLRINDVLKEVVEHEGKPLTDRLIIDGLNDKGIHIARRTPYAVRSPDTA